jgi:hypothetical protein
MSIRTVAGEVGRVINFHAVKGDGTDFDLTGATVTFHIDDDTTGLACALVDAATGKASYTSTADALQEGPHKYRLKVVSGGNTYYSRFGDLLVEKTTFEKTV